MPTIPSLAVADPSRIMPPPSGTPVCSGLRLRRNGLLLLATLAVAAASSSCSGSRALLLELLETRRLAAELASAFHKANEASNRAVLADTDDVSAASAKEAASATTLAAERLTSLDAMVQSLGYSAEADTLSRFRSRFTEYQRLDAEILTLAVENTNLKAQRLSFGAAREMAEGINVELQHVGNTALSGDGVNLEIQGIRADLFELLFLEARHNAEAGDTAMTQLEEHARKLAGDARARFRRLNAIASAPAAAPLHAAVSLFERFMPVHDEVIALSRRNTNVQSLALTFGRKRVVAAECEDALRELQESLAGHGSEATR